MNPNRIPLWSPSTRTKAAEKNISVPAPVLDSWPTFPSWYLGFGFRIVFHQQPFFTWHRAMNKSARSVHAFTQPSSPIGPLNAIRECFWRERWPAFRSPPAMRQNPIASPPADIDGCCQQRAVTWNSKAPIGVCLKFWRYSYVTNRFVEAKSSALLRVFSETASYATKTVHFQSQKCSLDNN